jgi:hypothetical protein
MGYQSEFDHSLSNFDNSFMKSFIQRPKKALWYKRIALAVLLFISTIVAGGSVQATTTYTYSGSHSLTWTSNGNKPISIERSGGYDSLSVYASMTGSSKFTIWPYRIYWDDTANDTGWEFDSIQSFYVSFSSSVKDTNYAKLVIHDADHADTISLVGYGTDDGIDYTFRLVNAYFDTTQSNISSANIYYDADSGNTASLDGIIYNHRTSPIEVGILLSDSTHWSVDGNGGSEELSLNGTTDHTSGRSFAVTYTPHGVYRDSVLVSFSCNSPYSESTSFWVYATDPRYAPIYYIPTVTGPYVAVDLGDTTCGTASVANTTTQPITITDVSFDANSGWFWSGLPSMPVTLEPGDSMTFLMCYAPGNAYVSPYQYAGINVSFTDSSGLTASTKGTATAIVYGSCIVSLLPRLDSLKLDEVIFGGYVECSESFVMHQDTELAAGKGVMYQGGSVQILSPTLPMNVHVGDTVTIVFRVIPPAMDSTIYGLGLYYGYIPLHLGECTALLSFEGTETDSVNNDLNLFTDQTGLMALTTTNSITVDTFWFDNNTTGNVLVTSVSLSNTTNFSLLGILPHSPNDSLTSGDKMAVIIQFDGDTNGFYHDSLIVVTENGWSAPVRNIFNLEAIRTEGVAGVSETPAPSSAMLSVVPNPASGPVTITMNGVQKATIAIYDILGNRILSNPPLNNDAYEWDHSGNTNGVYFVRVSGIDANGTPFVMSKQIVLNK